MSRRTAREASMKLVFQMAFNDDHVDEVGAEDILAQAKEELNYNNYQYIETVVSRTESNLQKIDEYIEKFSENWKIDRLSKVDLSILRLAISEILFFDDIPTRVSINEAVELAKKFSTDKASGYINGILDQVANQLNKAR
ncbi:transcription antitermination factor NusB [Natranaerobius thermophilus]|uniref:Transcription antitermination protein NusB n=1 Tax=Natranaerobius thermophilus (strain ATCC BAA-1301 / DSM 18059 / JW/NM-WN-LF) TaxID=457570 RepID=NUSB_NATTJ|nr:transcription antitermination factor NusB [Natranaerobius thermophilus]B2A534.1 RecName: Full=Transcription antitermination protein NusB; AltName: Full=Antitermination factor NusB [Natranaerobius thermophilus JW/NM-WN-LF]ACB85276.1 NusB antitermination factor [Natranaerobius thermophilus JW/NM-WN-LF]